MFLKNIKEKLGQTKIAGHIKSLFKANDPQIMEKIEELLIASDMGVTVTQHIMDKIKTKETYEETLTIIHDEIVDILKSHEAKLSLSPGLNVILMCGVNGSGKTTTIAKLAHHFKNKKVAFAACDTFRAAATEQLDIWAKRLNAPLYKGVKPESDPASVAYQAVQNALDDHIDVLFIDTAGRLHNKQNLMAELQKIIRVIQKLDDTAPHQTLLVLDATIGSNTFTQIDTFKQLLNITGLVMNKLDGTAKGGIIIKVAQHFALPLYFIGTGETKEDLKVFNAKDFTSALLI